MQVILSFTVVPWVITQRFLPPTEQRSISITPWINREDQLQTRKVKLLCAVMLIWHTHY